MGPYRKRVASALILAAGSGLAGCEAAGRMDGVARGDLPAIRRDYRNVIVRWAEGFYAQPRDVRRARISDPELTRDGTGRLVWLVCVEADVNLRDGRSDRQVVAFGFTPGDVSAPLQRDRSAVINGYCGERALAYRPFPALARL